jgi:hypothetical protein
MTQLKRSVNWCMGILHEPTGLVLKPGSSRLLTVIVDISPLVIRTIRWANKVIN